MSELGHPIFGKILIPEFSNINHIDSGIPESIPELNLVIKLLKVKDLNFNIIKNKVGIYLS